MIRIGERSQRTLARSAEVAGIGFLTGADVTLRFMPAEPNAGIVFVRTDRPGQPRIPARAARVTGTSRRTTLGTAPTQVSLVEHCLAALAGLRVDNCEIELDASEPPGLDGSAQAFADAICAAGTEVQPASRMMWAVSEPTTVRAGEATLTIHPTDVPELHASYMLDYGPRSVIDKQTHSLTITPESFLAELAMCRTFVLEREAEMLQRAGIGSRHTPRDLLVFGPRGVTGGNSLRFANEPARHKLLDMIGDLSLVGADLCGHVVAYRAGHSLNVELAKSLARQLFRPMMPSLRRAA